MPIAGAHGRTSEPPERSSPAPSSRLTREQVVDRIISINRTASVEFLEKFADRDLDRYLDHLVAASTPRGRHARWERPGDSPAIQGREAQD
ncbi:MAG: hypothetical protein WD749_14020 [Phycisphaerales bacterium]